MPKDIYLQPDAPDPVLDPALVLDLVRHHVAEAQAVTGVDESGGEARTYAIDTNIILKVQRPQQLRPRTSLAKEVAFLNALAADPAVRVPRVLGYGRVEPSIEYTVMTRMPGQAFRTAPPTGQVRRAMLYDLGRMLRRIHQTPQAPLLASHAFPGDADAAAVRARLRETFGEVVALIHAQSRQWNLAESPEVVAAAALERLPDADERVALHSNPGPEHVFIDPRTGAMTGIIDFGDAYVSHPTLDFRRWSLPEDRATLLEGYTSAAAVSDAFMATWLVVMILADLIAVAYYPERGAAAQADILSLLRAE